MKFRKFLIGVFLITVTVCGGGDFSTFSPGYSATNVTTCVLVLHRHCEEEAGSASPRHLRREADTDLHYKFTFKISYRFNSSPPRASPLA